jgi:hypothetical protein
LCFLITSKWAAPTIDLTKDDLPHTIMKEFIAVKKIIKDISFYVYDFDVN